jgi:hypothetical protein
VSKKRNWHRAYHRRTEQERELGQEDGKHVAGHTRICEDTTEGRNQQEMKVSSNRLDVGGLWRLALARNGVKATSLIVCHRSTIYISLHRPSDNMGLRDRLRDFLRLPQKDRARSETRSEMGSIEGPNETNPMVPRPTESTPDLRIRASTLPTSSPLTPRDLESSGTRATAF